MGLFRSETEQARASAWLGKIILIRPVSFALLTVAALGIAAALAATLLLGEFTRKARVSGIISPQAGVMRIIAPQSGIVVEINAAEGATVERDAPILRLADSRTVAPSTDVATAVTRRLSERRLALARQREFTLAAMLSEQSALAGRRAGLARELAQLDGELGSQFRRTELAQRAVSRARQLEEIGFLSSAGLDRERDTALDHESRLEASRRTRLALSRELGGIDFEVEGSRSRAQAQLAALDMQRAALEQEEIERELQYQARILAPAPGMVATVLVEAGQMVTTGTPLATLIPAGSRLEAHLFAPSRSIGFVRPGQEVLLRYLAYPHQKFGSYKARVMAVSRNPMQPAEMGFTPPDGSREPVYRIKVALDSQSVEVYGRHEPLRAGMQVEADVLLDRRRLIEWIFEPLLSLAGRT